MKFVRVTAFGYLLPFLTSQILPIAAFASAHVSGSFSYVSLACLAHWIQVIEDL